MIGKINDKLNVCYESLVNHDADDILASLTDRIKDREWYMNYLGRFDFKEFKINGNVLEIARMPGPLTAFRPVGTIKFKFQQTEKKNWTKITCKIFPYNNAIPLLMLVTLVASFGMIVVFWLVGWWSLDVTTLVMWSVLILIFPSAVGYVTYHRMKRALVDYSKDVIDLLNKLN